MATTSSGSNPGLLQPHRRGSRRSDSVTPVSNFLSRYETYLFTEQIRRAAARRNVAVSPLITSVGVPYSTFCSWGDPTHNGRRVRIPTVEHICTALNIRLPFQLRRCGQVVLSDGDQETWVDDILHRWQSTVQKRAYESPIPQIAALMFTRWEDLGFVPHMELQAPSLGRYACRITATALDPGLRYAAAFDTTSYPPTLHIIRVVHDTVADKWDHVQAADVELTGSNITWLDRRLTILKDRLYRDRKNNTSRKLKAVAAFEKSMKEFITQQQNVR